LKFADSSVEGYVLEVEISAFVDPGGRYGDLALGDAGEQSADLRQGCAAYVQVDVDRAVEGGFERCWRGRRFAGAVAVADVSS
jgi:hypothetical protein